MNQTNNTIQFSQFAAVSKDSDEVLGKILYYTLSSILIDREVLARLCDTVDFPYKPIRRSSLADAFRSATGDIYHRLVVKDAGVPQIINVYCRDNRGPKGIISRELSRRHFMRIPTSTRSWRISAWTGAAAYSPMTTWRPIPMWTRSPAARTRRSCLRSTRPAPAAGRSTRCCKTIWTPCRR